MTDIQGNESLKPGELADRLTKEEREPYFVKDTALFTRIDEHLKTQSDDEVLQTQQAAELLLAKLTEVLTGNSEFQKRSSEVDEEARSLHGIIFSNGDFVYKFWQQAISDFEQQAIITRKKIGEGSADVAATIRERPADPISFWDEELVITSYNGPGDRGLVSGPSLYFRRDQDGKLFPGSDPLSLNMDEELGKVSKYGSPTDTEFVEWGAQSFLLDLKPPIG